MTRKPSPSLTSHSPATFVLLTFKICAPCANFRRWNSPRCTKYRIPALSHPCHRCHPWFDGCGSAALGNLWFIVLGALGARNEPAMRDLLTDLKTALDQGRDCVYCTLVEARGSTPQKAGAAMHGFS